MTRKGFELIWEHTLDQHQKASFKLSSNQFNELDLVKTALIKASEAKGETFVIKLTEDIIDDEILLTNFAENINILSKVGINIIIVHESGNLVGDTLKYFGIEDKFIQDTRVADYKTSQIIEMVISGYINKKIVSKLCSLGCNAIGISGKDANMIEAHNFKMSKKREEKQDYNIIDMGFIGEPILINPEILAEFEEAGIIPVISPIAFGKNGATYLLDSDLTAAIIASALSAERLIFLSQQEMLAINEILITEINVDELKGYLNNGKIKGEIKGIIEAAISAIDNAAGVVHIINSQEKDAMLLNLFTEGKSGLKIRCF